MNKTHGKNYTTTQETLFTVLHPLLKEKLLTQKRPATHHKQSRELIRAPGANTEVQHT